MKKNKKQKQNKAKASCTAWDNDQLLAVRAASSENRAKFWRSGTAAGCRALHLPAAPAFPGWPPAWVGGWALSLTLPATNALRGVHVRPACPPGLRVVNCTELSPPPLSEVVTGRQAAGGLNYDD